MLRGLVGGGLGAFELLTTPLFGWPATHMVDEPPWSISIACTVCHRAAYLEHS